MHKMVYTTCFCKLVYPLVSSGGSCDATVHAASGEPQGSSRSTCCRPQRCDTMVISAWLWPNHAP